MPYILEPIPPVPVHALYYNIGYAVRFVYYAHAMYGRRDRSAAAAEDTVPFGCKEIRAQT